MIAKFILKLFGWRVQENLPEGINRCVMIAAPHTSNWDFLFARLAFSVLDIPVKFTIKDTWFKFPFNLIFGPLGGIPINRRPKKEGEKRSSTVDAMADLFKTNDEIAIMVTPEGTRSKRTEWKTGFYHVAKKAGVPIGLGFVDYKDKEAGVRELIYPTDDMDADFRKIMAFYKGKTPRHAHRYSIDERYV